MIQIMSAHVEEPRSRVIWSMWSTRYSCCVCFTPYSVFSLSDVHTSSKLDTDKARRDVQRARKKKQICFCIVVVTLIIVAVALAIYFGAFKRGINGGSN